MTQKEMDALIAEAGKVVQFGTTIVGAIPGIGSAVGKLFGGDGNPNLAAQLAQISEDEKVILRNTTTILTELTAFQNSTRQQFQQVLTAIHDATKEISLNIATAAVNGPLGKR
jgi:hypothetical protein